MAALQFGLLLVFASLVTGITPPEFITPNKKDTVYFKAGTDVTLQCQANGDPTPTYWWWKGEKPIAETQYIKVHPVSGDLSISEYSLRDDGYYMCVATSQTQVDPRSKAASLSSVQRIRQIREGQFNSVPKTFEQKQYMYLMIPCNLTREYVGYGDNFKWYYGEKTNQVTDFDNGRMYIDANHNLHFTYLKLEDQSKAGQDYICGLVAKSAIYLGGSNNLRVTQVQDNVLIPYTLAYSNSGVKIQLYADADLECVFSGYDPASTVLPRITWLDNNDRPIGENTNDAKYTISADTRRLSIKAVTGEDEGVYKCYINNFNPQNVELDVVSAPYFEKDSDKPIPQMVRAEGEDVTFTCNAISMPNEAPPQVPTWYINSYEFGSSFSAQKFQLSGDSKQLTILNVRKPEDTLCVQCMVKNEIGTTWASGCVRIILSIDITMRPPERQEVEKGDDVDLTVRATKDPSITKLTYIWHFNNETYVDKLPPHVKQDGTKDYINTTDLTKEEYQSIAGVYTINIRNAHEEKTITTEVVLVDKPVVAAATAGGGFPMWIIIVIVCVLLLLLILLCIICVICRKKQEGDYNVDKKEVGAGLNPEDELKSKGFDDFSRPQDYDEYDYPDKPRHDIPYEDDALVPDEVDSEDEEAFFNEDGSFIGQYHKKDLARDRPKEPNESNI